ncbi:5-formyltetrahydrofolate cyclo-ligase [Fulvivirgaceae bacterium BMA10]|uniref:5-formyltetrahydrofolate cyclo-ligase n=1 Tax=Splendidivirga corallicola TaxID=3051826 RepID=A0ABT8KIQ4_9BACT|nr:5-formyltetrahydrofolate cyclo-ligase [Fulvivirgaceae bacterium BMA10]
MRKADLRKHFQQKRTELSQEDYQRINKAIMLLFFQSIDIERFNHVHIFLPMKQRKEVDTWLIINELRQRNHQVILPKCDFGKTTLINYYYDRDTKLATNSWGVEEPTGGNMASEEEIDLVIVPLLAFDFRGYRVGYGKGFYDRFLTKCRKDTLKIGLSMFDPIPQISDVNEFDIRLDICITPNKIHAF